MLLLEALDPHKPVALVMHRNADPDVIASAIVLQHILDWACKTEQRFEIISLDPLEQLYSKTFLNVSSVRFDISYIESICTSDYQAVYLDSSPFESNSAIFEDIRAVIDHHDINLKKLEGIPFVRIEKVGSTATMITRMAVKNKIPITPLHATLLLTGLFVDTQELTSNVMEQDLDVYKLLYLQANHTLFRQFVNSTKMIEELDIYTISLNNYRVDVNRGILLACIGVTDTPSRLAIIAEFFLKFRGIHTVMSFGEGVHGFRFSLRTTSHNAAETMQRFMARIGGQGGGKYFQAGGAVNDKKFVVYPVPETMTKLMNILSEEIDIAEKGGAYVECNT